MSDPGRRESNPLLSPVGTAPGWLTWPQADVPEDWLGHYRRALLFSYLYVVPIKQISACVNSILASSEIWSFTLKYNIWMSFIYKQASIDLAPGDFLLWVLPTVLMNFTGPHTISLHNPYLWELARNRVKVIHVHKERSSDPGILSLLISLQYKGLKGSIDPLRK